MWVASPHSILRIQKCLIACVITKVKIVSTGWTQVEGAEGRSPCRVTIQPLRTHPVTPHLPFMNRRRGEPPNRGLTRSLKPNRPLAHWWPESQRLAKGWWERERNRPNRGVTRTHRAQSASRIADESGNRTPPIEGLREPVVPNRPLG